MIPNVRAALHNKSAVALSSVVAAIVLTTMKLVVGFSTGSLGILAEAAQSALDLVATITTLVAVRVAERAPDESHPYGHGRFESVAALFETALLLATAGWVVWLAIERLMSGSTEVDTSIWAFGVMAVSIAIDWSRSRVLMRAAREHESQALEADALHFSTDMWSSAVVIVGLALVWLGQRLPGAELLGRADAVAAIVVGAIVVWVSARLGLQTLASLVDTAPHGLVDEIRRRAESCQGVLAARRVRLRRAGNKSFADLMVTVGRTTTFAGAHEIADRVEERVHELLPNADVVVHVEPAPSPAESAAEQIQFVARQRGVEVHDVRVRQVGDRTEVDLHLELDPALTLADAHEVASGLERELLANDQRLSEVNTHLEAPETRIVRDEEITSGHPDVVRRVREVADHVAGPNATHEVRLYRSGRVTNMVLHATFPPHESIERVHEVSARIERALRAELQGVGTVLVHAEPPA